MVAGYAVDIHPDEPVRVLPAGGGDHSPHLPGSSSAWQISHICHDPSLLKVSGHISLLKGQCHETKQLSEIKSHNILHIAESESKSSRVSGFF